MITSTTARRRVLPKAISTRSIIFCAVILTLISTQRVSAQRPDTAPADTARARLQPLKWMIGEWSGPAKVSSGGQQFVITQHEHVIAAASGTVLLIQGLGTMSDGSGGERRARALHHCTRQNRKLDGNWGDNERWRGRYANI